jgi:hypothetical protein
MYNLTLFQIMNRTTAQPHNRTTAQRWVNFKSIRFIKLFLVLCFFTLSCKENIELEGKENSKDSSYITKEEAQTWFVENYIKGAKQNDEKFLKRDIHWSKAKNVKIGKRETIVVPVTHYEKGRPNFHKEAIIVKDKKGNKQLMIAEYIREKSDTLKKEFSGIVTYRTWENEFIYGFTLKNSRVRSILLKENGKTVLPRLTAESNKKARDDAEYLQCWEYCYQMWYKTCVQVTPFVRICFDEVLSEETCTISCQYLREDYYQPGFFWWDANTIHSWAASHISIAPSVDDRNRNFYSYTNPCAAFDATMNDSQFKEQHGIITTGGLAIVFPDGGNDNIHSAWHTVIEGPIAVNNWHNSSVDVYHNATINWGEGKIYFNHSDISKELVLDIAGTFHTHPVHNADPDRHSLTDASELDKAFAGERPHIKHEVWNAYSRQKTRYNQNGTTSESTYVDNCP